jgi:putative ABC transport system permease protein
MIKNYLKTAWRNLRRNKLYSIINIGGLAIGMAISFMLLLYVYNEFSFDKYHANDARLYKVLRNQPNEGEIYTNGSTPVQVAGTIVKDFPEVEKVARTNGGYDVLINYQDKALKLGMMAADASILDMFSFDFVKGDKRRALTDQSSVVLTEAGARALFGNDNPIGKVIKFDNKTPLTVSAIIKDHPLNSSFKFKLLISWKAYEAMQPWVKNSSWGNYSFTTYAMLKSDVSLAAVNAKMKKIIARYDPNNKQNETFLYKFSSLHLYNTFKNGKVIGGSIEYVRLFLFLAIGILIIACINFMNLSTARSERRAREVGVRKAVGARRFAIVQQFMGESLLMAFLALILSLVLMVALLPVFNGIMNLKLGFPYGNAWAWLAAIAVTIFTGLVSGSYPALFLSSFNPIKVLKGQFITTKTTVRPRQVLVVMQFTFAICLILSSLFVYKQINYIKNRPVGYDRNGLIALDVEGSLDNASKFERFRLDAINAGAIVDGVMASGTITDYGSSTWGVIWPGQHPGEEKIPIDQIATGYHFISTYGLTMAQGRDFAMDRPADSNAVILNEAAVALMRLKQPLGQLVKWQGRDRAVVGVVKNFVWGSPYEPVKPAIIGFAKDWTGGIGLRLNPKFSVSNNLAILQGIYKKYNPEYPFEYKFIDENFSNKFKTEKLLGTMAASFTGLAIVISCLGLFGLASFSAEQRKKEIGIRKVLGASTGNLWFKLSQEFIKLVLISFILGSVISWYYLDQWLSKYTYHTSLSIWVFVITMVISVGICLITVSWQAIKAAWINPVTSLRSE